MNDSLRTQFGKRLKAIRMAHKLTQEDLADMAQLDYKYFQKIEGKNPPNVSLKIIERLAAALKVKPAKFFE